MTTATALPPEAEDDEPLDPLAESLSRRRDLKSQIAELANEDDREIIFRDTSPPRRMLTVYSRVDGERIRMPKKLAEKALDKRLPADQGGGFMFTLRKAEAPRYRKGTVKCFLHAESAERASGLLEEAGVARFRCPAGALASAHDRRTHAENRHKRQWAAVRELVEEQRREAAERRQDAQFETIRALAENAGGKVAGKKKGDE